MPVAGLNPAEAIGMAASVRIGCSGWQYAHWRGDFYPRGLPTERWLEYYTGHFDTVELNNSFYRLPSVRAFEGWRLRVPDDFCFAVKASRYLTHLRRLRDPGEPLALFWSRARHLGDRLGPVLYQLPPRWRRNVERLGTFLDGAPPERAQAVEFRDPSWYDGAIYDELHRHAIALCLHDMPGSASPRTPIGPFVYLRFHGAGTRYGGAYPPQRLAAWADRIVGWGLPAYVYFNNDVGGHAVRDAARLRELVARRLSS